MMWADDQLTLSFCCLYCNEWKDVGESSVEHAIPQFLGGAQTPGRFKLRNVCQACNNNLGLHVDAAYGRSWMVANRLAIAARKHYAGPGKEQIPLPLVCMGGFDAPGLEIPSGHVSEFWVGPSGEHVIWIRPSSDAMYWYVGGDPVHAKRSVSTLFFVPTTNNPVLAKIGLDAFAYAFRKLKHARRIFGAELVGVPPGTVMPGFDTPTAAESEGVLAIRRTTADKSVDMRTSINVKYDLRFAYKSVLAIGYSLFGSAFLGTKTAALARAGLWQKLEKDEGLWGVSSLQEDGSKFANLIGYPGAVVILISRVDQSYALSLIIDQNLSFSVELAHQSLVAEPVIPDFGLVLVLLPHKNRFIELDLPNYLAHKQRGLKHAGLAAVDAMAAQAERFWSELGRKG